MIKTISTNTRVLAEDITDVLIDIAQVQLPDNVLQLLHKTVDNQIFESFADKLEESFMEGFDGWDLHHQFFHGTTFGYIKMLTMSVDHSKVEELRKFFEGRVSRRLERRKAAEARDGRAWDEEAPPRYPNPTPPQRRSLFD